MKGDPIPDVDHTARYCKPSWVQDGVPLVDAFLNAANEAHVSVNWMEFFDVDAREEQISRIRAVFAAKGYVLKPNGRFAVLNVGNSVLQVEEGAQKIISFLHWPEDNDDSHSGIFDYGAEDLQVAVELANSITPYAVFLAVPN